MQIQITNVILCPTRWPGFYFRVKMSNFWRNNNTENESSPSLAYQILDPRLLCQSKHPALHRLASSSRSLDFKSNILEMNGVSASITSGNNWLFLRDQCTWSMLSGEYWAIRVIFLFGAKNTDKNLIFTGTQFKAHFTQKTKKKSNQFFNVMMLIYSRTG